MSTVTLQQPDGLDATSVTVDRTVYEVEDGVLEVDPAHAGVLEQRFGFRRVARKAEKSSGSKAGAGRKSEGGKKADDGKQAGDNVKASTPKAEDTKTEEPKTPEPKTAPAKKATRGRKASSKGKAS